MLMILTSTFLFDSLSCDSSVWLLSAVFDEVQSWMVANKLLLYPSKTDFISSIGLILVCHRLMPCALDTGTIEVTNCNYNYINASSH